jgi:cytochrome b
MVRFFRFAYSALAWLFVAAVLTQAFFAGAGLFHWTTMDTHIGFGYVVIFLPMFMLLLGVPARIDRRTALLNVLLFVMAFIQPILVYAKEDAPVLAAFHPVNAMLLFVLGVLIGTRSVQLARASRKVKTLHTAQASAIHGD